MSRPCPVCASGLAPGPAGLLHCAGCGLALNTGAAQGEPVYAPGAAAAIYGSSKSGLFSAALDLLGPPAPGRDRLLDVGCATGVFLDEAAARGWKAEGVEVSAPLAEAAAARGHTVHREPVEAAGLAGGSYDAVTALEVFSQMRDPAAAAAELFRLLKPGGAICIREFNAGFHLPLSALERRGFFRPLGASPSVLHALNFRARTLRIMLERAGFNSVAVFNSPPTSGDPYGTGGRLGGLLTGALKVLYYSLARALGLLTGGRALAGSSLIATARK